MAPGVTPRCGDDECSGVCPECTPALFCQACQAPLDEDGECPECPQGGIMLTPEPPERDPDEARDERDFGWRTA